MADEVVAEAAFGDERLHADRAGHPQRKEAPSRAEQRHVGGHAGGDAIGPAADGLNSASDDERANSAEPFENAGRHPTSIGRRSQTAPRLLQPGYDAKARWFGLASSIISRRRRRTIIGRPPCGHSVTRNTGQTR